MSIHVYTRELVTGRWNINNVHYVDAQNYPIPLATQVKGVLPGKVFTLRCNGAVATFDFADELTAPEIALLDTAVAEHKAPTSSDPPTTHIGRPTAQLLGTTVVDLDATWKEVGGVVTNPGFWVPNPAMSFSVVTLCAEVDGVGAEMKVVQVVGGVETDLNSIPVALPDSGGAWSTFSFTTDQPPQGGQEARYVVKARLGAATSANIKELSIALVEIDVVST
jgi:hypothetical protein